MAWTYSNAGQYQTALTLLRKSLEIRRAAFGAEHPTSIKSLHGVALVHGSMGQYAAAEPLFQEARNLACTALGERDEEYAKITDSFGVLYRRMGDYRKAEVLLREAVALKRDIFGARAPSYATSVNNLALVYDDMGRYGEAEPLFKEALEIRRAAIRENHLIFAQALNNLGTLYGAKGNYADAESFLQQALKVAADSVGQYHPDIALYLNNLGQVYIWIGDYTEALRLHHQVLQIRERILTPDHPDIAVSLRQLASLYEKMGDHQRAEDLYERAIQIQLQALGLSHPDVLETYAHMARFYAVARRDTVRAESLFSKVIAMRRSVLGDNHADLTRALQDLAILHHRSGKYAAAEPLYREALRIFRAVLGDNHPWIADILHPLASLALATGDANAALGLAREASVNDDAALAHVFSFSSERQRMAYVDSVMARFFSTLSIVAQSFTRDHDAVRWTLELAWKRKAIGIEVLTMVRELVLGGRYPDLEPQLHALIALRVQIAQKSKAGPGAGDPQTHQQTLTHWKAEHDGLEQALVRQIPEIELDQRLSAASCKAVADSLPPASALIEFIRFPVFDFRARPGYDEPQWKPARYAAFVLLADHADRVTMVDLGDASKIEQLIAAYRSAITGETEIDPADRGAPDVAASAKTREAALRAVMLERTRHLSPHPQSQHMAGLQSGTELRKALFDPLLPAIGKCTRLFVAPDGDLARLPFEVLPLGHERFVVDDYEISYLGVGRDILRFGQSRASEPAPPLVAADPDFDLHVGDLPQPPPGGHFNRLQGTRTEGVAIAKLLQIQPWLDEQVLKGPLKALASPRILHVATHGFFVPDPLRDLKAFWSPLRVQESNRHVLANPLLRSGLALAGVNTFLRGGMLPAEAEDGFLTAEDVTGLDLRSTELAVLSACSTGLGDVKIGEGVLGLRRSFIQAGASTLVMSLWKVPDDETAELMEHFYRQVLAGQPRVSALREAQRALKVKHANPFYWGAFICQGDPGPLATYDFSS